MGEIVEVHDVDDPRLADFRDLTVPELIARSHHLAVLEGVNDHENLGGLLRNAAALGVDAVHGARSGLAQRRHRRCDRLRDRALRLE